MPPARAAAGRVRPIGAQWPRARAAELPQDRAHVWRWSVEAPRGLWRRNCACSTRDRHTHCRLTGKVQTHTLAARTDRGNVAHVRIKVEGGKQVDGRSHRFAPPAGRICRVAHHLRQRVSKPSTETRSSPGANSSGCTSLDRKARGWIGAFGTALLTPNHGRANAPSSSRRRRVTLLRMSGPLIDAHRNCLLMHARIPTRRTLGLLELWPDYLPVIRTQVHTCHSASRVRFDE